MKHQLTSQKKASPHSEIAATSRWDRIIGGVLLGSGIVGLFASFMLAVEEVTHLKHPTQALACDLNPLIGCGNILDTWQGHAIFGIPNEFFGIVAFSVILTLGVLTLTKIRFPQWVWRGLQVGAIGGVAFVAWFMYQSLAVLNHLCPYCMTTWAATLLLSWYITAYNLRSGYLTQSLSLQKVRDFVIRHHLDVIITVYVVIIIGILYRFRGFFFHSH